MKSLLSSLTLSASLFAASAHAALDFRLTAPDLESTLMQLSVEGSFIPSVDFSGESLGLEVTGDVGGSDFPKGTIRSKAAFTLSEEGDTDVEQIDLVYYSRAPGSPDSIGFVFNPSANLLAGLSYTVSGTTTFNIRRSSATFADLNPGTYKLGPSPVFGEGGTLEIALQPIPEPAAAAIAGIAIFGFILALRRARYRDLGSSR